MSDDISLRSVQRAFLLLIVVLGGILSIHFRLYICIPLNRTEHIIVLMIFSSMQIP